MENRLEEILTSEFVTKEIIYNLDYLTKIIPELDMMISFNQKHPHHNLDLFSHTIAALSLSPNDFEIRLVLLLHDIGKPYYYIEGDVRHYPKHALLSSIITKNILNRLGYDENFINRICLMIKYHDSNLLKNNNNRTFLKKMYIVQYCDAYAHNPKYLGKRINYLTKLRKRIGGINE